MTNPSEVKISDAEIEALCDALGLLKCAPGSRWHKHYGQALAAFLARRVPDEKPRVFGPQIPAEAHNNRLGFNACRARVLAGPEE
jgi:hypothetical protein